MGYIFDALIKDDQPGTQADPRPHNIGGPPTISVQNHPIPASSPDDEAVVDVDAGSVDDRLIVLTEPQSLIAEEYRSIRTGLLARWQHKRHLIHTITSATPQDGKTITSLNLGLSFSELRTRRTVVVEADFRLPQFTHLLGLEPQTPGILDVLQGQEKLSQIIQRVGNDRLHVLPAGYRTCNDAVQLLSGAAMASLLKQLRNKYDHIIIDTPPVLELADAGIVGAFSDDVLLIAQMNRTPRTLIEQAIKTLTSYNAPVAGIIATNQNRANQRYYYSRYESRYSMKIHNKAA